MREDDEFASYHARRSGGPRRGPHSSCLLPPRDALPWALRKMCIALVDTRPNIAYATTTQRRSGMALLAQADNKHAGQGTSGWTQRDGSMCRVCGSSASRTDRTASGTDVTRQRSTLKMFIAFSAPNRSRTAGSASPARIRSGPRVRQKILWGGLREPELHRRFRRKNAKSEQSRKRHFRADAPSRGA